MFGNAMAYMLSQLDPDVRVLAVGSVDQALDQLTAAGPFDLVLLDYDMPRTNGFCHSAPRVGQQQPAVWRDHF